MKPGYYRFGEASHHVYACEYPANCRGGSGSGGGGFDADLLCTDNAHGPLCTCQLTIHS